MVERVGVIGLGVMGSAVSVHLLAAGYELFGFDISEVRRDAFAALGGTVQQSGAEVAERADLVMFWLPSVPALEAATADVVSGAHQGLIVAEMGVLPIGAKTAARARFAEAGVELMDAPVSGTGLQAADATLVVMASGSEESFAATRAVFDVIGHTTHYLGPFPNGSILKFIANLLVAVHTLSAAEAHALGIAAGMDPAIVQKVVADGVGSSRMLEIRGPMMAADTYEPPSARLDIIKKDAGIIADFARSVGAPTPLLDAALPVYEAASASGLGGLDAAALLRYLETLGDLGR